MPVSAAQKAHVAARRTAAIRLRLAGEQWQTIADQLGYASRGAACADVGRALAANAAEEREQVETLRYVESQRLDELQRALWDTAMAGDVKAVEAILKISDRRVRLFGLDAPVRADVTATVDNSFAGMTEQERIERITELHTLVGRRLRAVHGDDDYDDEDLLHDTAQ